VNASVVDVLPAAGGTAPPSQLAALSKVPVAVAVQVYVWADAVLATAPRSGKLNKTNNSKRRVWELTRSTFPPGYVDHAVPLSPRRRKHSFTQFYLPYIEQGNVIRDYDFDRAWDDKVAPAGKRSNFAIVSVDIPVLLCPSAPEARVGKHMTDYIVQDTLGTTTRERQIFGLPTSGTLPLPMIEGFFGRGENKPVKIGQVSDGLSNTMMVLEDTGRPQYWLYGKLGTGNSSNWPWSDPSNRITVQVASACNKGKTFFNCNNNNEIYSFHAGNSGANFLFGDGSVVFIRDSIPAAAFVPLFTRAGGEVTPGDY
jgi:prepilin-type processing-associated H-X9-DG protein